MGAMMDQRWVQHISGQGEKWRVKDVPVNYEDHLSWCIEGNAGGFDRSFLVPTSEYVLCDPPERWVDVTEKCKVNTHGTLVHFDGADHSINGVILTVQEGYRLRKVPRLYSGEALEKLPPITPTDKWAFIVEKMVSL